MVLKHAVLDTKTGWLACGPVVVAAITGARLSEVEDVFVRIDSKGVATTALELHQALSFFDRGLSLGYMAEYGEEQPLWWVLRFCPGNRPLIIAIETERGSHWIATHGWWLADVQTYGRWIEWDDHGLHADAPVGMVWVVERR
jgi:hypothetical protein